MKYSLGLVAGLLFGSAISATVQNHEWIFFLMIGAALSCIVISWSMTENKQNKKA